MLRFTDLTPEGEAYFNQLEKLIGLEVQVGFQADSGVYENGSTVAEIAAYNELGTSSIPPRPFMQQSFENHESELQSACDQVNETINSGGSAESALDQLGVVCKGLVQMEILDGGFEPNDPATIKKKGSSQPLIDTGQMRQSVQYVIKSAGS
jgi:hypothetical protein